MKNLGLILTLFILFSFNSLRAQTHLGIQLTGGFPMNEFKENSDAVGFGGNINLMFPFFKKSPLFLGFDLGYQMYGYRSNTQSVNAQIVANGQVISSIPMNFKITNTNNLLNGHLILRLKIPLPIVQPYIDGMIGFKNLYTRTTIENVTNNYNNYNYNTNTTNNNIINSRTNLTDWASSYGYGGGFMFKIGSGVALDLRCVYLLGSEARYFDKSSTSTWDIRFQQGTGNNIEPISSTNTLSMKKSKTDMLFVSMGLTINLGSDR